MDAAGRRELESIKAELQSIINELDSIASGVRNDFKNIGNDRCSTAVTKVADRYREAKRRLNNI